MKSWWTVKVPRLSTKCDSEISAQPNQGFFFMATLWGTNISVFLFPRWDMLVPQRVFFSFCFSEICILQIIFLRMFTKKRMHAKKKHELTAKNSHHLRKGCIKSSNYQAWLVVEPTHLKNMLKSNGIISHLNQGESPKNIWKHGSFFRSHKRRCVVTQHGKVIK